MNYPVTEIFHSIQGEGANTGRSAIFVRFAGCNLACSINISGVDYPCDEPFHEDPTAKKFMSVEEIMEKINSLGPAEIVVITGGEPTLYDLSPLINAINSDQLTWRSKVFKIHPLPLEWKGIFSVVGESGPLVCLETNGTRRIQGHLDFICVAPKPTHFGKNGNTPVLSGVLDLADEIRLVVGWESIDTLQKLIEHYSRNYDAQIYISPLTKFPGNLLISETAEKAVELVKVNATFGVRLSLQTHKWLQIR